MLQHVIEIGHPVFDKAVSRLSRSSASVASRWRVMMREFTFADFSARLAFNDDSISARRSG